MVELHKGDCLKIMKDLPNMEKTLANLCTGDFIYEVLSGCHMEPFYT